MHDMIFNDLFSAREWIMNLAKPLAAFKMADRALRCCRERQDKDCCNKVFHGIAPNMELTLIRREDLQSIADAARLGDQVSARLLHAVQSFQDQATGKDCLTCSGRFGIDVTPGAFWINDKIAIGVCTDCARQSDRRLRRRVQRFTIGT
jgi:hypothetical protein